MKILHVSFFSELSQSSGGKVCSMRNLNALRKLYGENNVIAYCVERGRQSGGNPVLWAAKQLYSDIHYRHLCGMSNKHLEKILEIVEKEKITTVFLCSSLFGQIAKRIKKQYHDVKVISYFHNVESIFFKQLVKHDKSIKNLYRPYVAKYNEKLAIKYSDTIICINNRDSKMVNELYHRKADGIVPISIVDKFEEYKPKIVQKPLNLLFVGSYFYPNIEAVNFLEDKVLPYVDAKLIIVGSGMDKLIKRSKKTSIYSNVPSLAPFYQKADAVILPIFSGSGMKIKTCEAMMYGKVILGTEEAFEGYNTDKRFTMECNSDKEFINSINNYQFETNYSEESRNNFLSNYSNNSAYKMFEKILEK